MTIYLTRHGETNYNIEKRYMGSQDIPLNENGLAQARELARRLKSEPIDIIVASPLMRAKKTAEIVGEELGLPVVIYPEFKERNMGVYEHLTKEDVKRTYPALFQRKSNKVWDDAPDGGETIEQLEWRVFCGLEKIKENFAGKNILLVGHGLVAKSVDRYFKKTSFEEMMAFLIGNCEVFLYEI